MAEFQIIYGHKEQPKEEWEVYRKVVTDDNTTSQIIDTWGNPQEANAICKELNENFKASYEMQSLAAMLKRLPDPIDYIARETGREDYQAFEVQGEEFHCAELKTDGTISYYSTLYDAYDDRRSNMKIGRYLRKYTNKDDNEISTICARYGHEFGDAVVQFAKTREEIRHVYENGPRSCMSGCADNFSLGGNIHPSEAYASGDFEVAYLTRDDRITARCVVVPSKKIRSSIYGDYTRMSEALAELGYTADYSPEDLYGLKLLKIPYSNRYALPYLDIADYVSEHSDGKHLVISSSGAYSGEEGYIYDDMSNEDDHGDEEYDY